MICVSCCFELFSVKKQTIRRSQCGCLAPSWPFLVSRRWIRWFWRVICCAEGECGAAHSQDSVVEWSGRAAAWIRWPTLVPFRIPWWGVESSHLWTGGSADSSHHVSWWLGSQSKKVRWASPIRGTVLPRHRTLSAAAWLLWPADWDPSPQFRACVCWN